MYLDTNNKNFCYKLAAYAQSNRDGSLRHEMARSHEHLAATKRQMQMEAVSARIFLERPGGSRARGREAMEALPRLGTMPGCWGLLLWQPCLVPRGIPASPQGCELLCLPPIAPLSSNVPTKQGEELFKLEDNDRR